MALCGESAEDEAVVAGAGGGVSVGGLLSKRNSHPLIQHVCVPAPSLHGRYPLPRYYGPVRLPTRPPYGYLFPQDVGSRRLVGSPRFLDRSVLARRLQPPRKVRRVLTPVTSPSISGFTTLWRAGHLPLHNGAESSSLALRLTSSPLQGFASGITPPRACRATCRMGSLQGELLSVHKIDQAYPGTSEEGKLRLLAFSLLSANIRQPTVGHPAQRFPDRRPLRDSFVIWPATATHSPTALL
jgi:hypothetical protein